MPFLMYLNHTYVRFVDFKLDYNNFLINDLNEYKFCYKITDKRKREMDKRT